VVQPVLVALGQQRRVTVAWVIGSVVYVGLLLLPVQPVTAALIAQLTGPAVVLVLLSAEAVRVLSRTGSRLTADHGSTAEAGTGVRLDAEERST